MGEFFKIIIFKESLFNNYLLLLKNFLFVVSGILIVKVECVIGKKWIVNWYYV